MVTEINYGEDPTTLSPISLPAGITSRFVDTSPQSLKFHILESTPSGSHSNFQPPLILLVHGFPNLAYDWRFILPRLAQAGYYAVAFDQRGYGRTHNADLSPISDSTFTPLHLVRDIVALVNALGYRTIHTLVGHDFGATTSTYVTLMRPDLMRSLVLMSHPFKGAPEIMSYATSPSPDLPKPPPLPKSSQEALRDPDVHQSLLQLNPPRKHYKWYYCEPRANEEMTNPTGDKLHEFLRGYFHLKSHDYTLNKPHALKSWTAPELAQMPHYYIMEAKHTMRENVCMDMSQESPEVLSKLSTTPWLPDDSLAVYVGEWTRTTFRGGLNWYKVFTSPTNTAEISFLTGAKLSVPTTFVSGVADWGNFQEPGAIEAMEEERSVKKGMYKGTVMVQGAGHWVNQEKPDECVREILKMAALVGNDSNST